jgi:UDP-glucose 4-epimerase
MNVGTGRGSSVREVIKLVCEGAGRSDLVAEEKERRAGDPAFLCADVNLIQKEIRFNSLTALKSSIDSVKFNK